MAKGAVKYYDDISGTWKYLMQGPKGPKGDSGAGSGDMEKSVYDPAGKDRQLAADNEVVKLTGNQTVAGVKAFSSSPVVPTPTTSGQAATKGYVDGSIVAPPVTSVNTRTGAVTGLAEQSALTAHTGNTANPHSVTKAQVGLSNVDNTSNTTERAATATLTNKRINPRVSSTASASSVTPTIATYDQYIYTALAANLTINAPTGTPVNGNKLLFAIKDNGTSRTLTWNAAFAPAGIDMPTSTTIGKWHYVGFIYNSTAAKWHCIAATVEA